MAIFRRSSPGNSSPAAAVSPAGGGSEAASGAGARRGNATVTVIAPGTAIRGEITGATEIQILGEVAGEVRVDGLVEVGASGAVVGPVRARVVRVVGRVTGNLTAADLVEVGPAGNVDGDIVAPRVVIAEGAFFSGSIDMNSGKDQQPRHPNQPATPTPTSTAADTGSL